MNTGKIGLWIEKFSKRQLRRSRGGRADSRDFRSCRQFVLGALLLLCASQAQAGNAPPAMITPGQFNVSPTGAFTYTIPIAVPPGTGGMVPALSLDYSSQNGDGFVGLGWVLSGLPSVTRCPQTFAQDSVHGSVTFGQNTTYPDGFCLEGQRLVSIGSSSLCTGGTEYRTEIDGFSRIVSCGNVGNGPQYFKAWTKSGQVMEFGSNPNFQVFPVKWDRSALLASIRIWPVNKISDTVGNYLTVTYNNGVRDDQNGQVYPSEIDYTANSAQGLAAHNSVRFLYAFKDLGASVPMYQAGSLLETTVILREIDTCTNVGGDCAYASRYYVNYNGADNNTGFVTQGDQHDEVTQIQQCDNGGNCLAPTKFTWQGSRDKLTINQFANVTFQTAYNTGTVVPGDFDGDGILDLIPSPRDTNGNCGVWLGSGDGHTFTNGNFNSSYMDYIHDGDLNKWSLRPESLCNPDKADMTVDSLDLNGDGLTDISIEVHNSLGNAYRATFTNTGGGRLTENPYMLPSSDTRYGDFDGDGRSDIFINTPQAYAYLSNGDGSFVSSDSYSGNGTLGRAVIPPDFDGNGCGDVLYLNIHSITFFCNPAVSTVSVPSNWGSTRAITLGDFNGDGKTDVLTTIPDSLSAAAQLFLSTGTGFATTITLPQTDWGRYSIYTGDFNGDGKTDLLLVAAGTGNNGYSYTSHQLWLSTGTGFVQANVTIPYATTNNYGDYHPPSIRAIVADWNNDGASDVWIEKPSGDQQFLFTYTPEAVKTVTNGIGVTTTVTYDRLNKNKPLYAKGTDASGCTGQAPSVTPSPCTTNLDGPLYVVKQVTSSDGVGGNYSSTYAYAGAKANLMGRGFLGFAQVAITDSQTHIVQTTNYRTDFPYVGLVASQNKVCPVANCPNNANLDVTLSSTTNTYDDVRSGTANNYYYAVRLRTSITQGNDIDASTTALPTVETDYDSYDGYGNAWRVTVNTTPPGGSSPDVTKVTVNTFTNDDGTNWFLGRLTAAAVTSTLYNPDGTIASRITRHSGFSYYPNNGLLSEEVVESNHSDTSNLKITTDYIYDGFGNKTSATVTGSGNPGPPACQTTTAYDTNAGQFPVTVTNCLSQSETWGTVTSPAYDPRFGLPTTHTGPNGLPTVWAYDGFGRRQVETRPDLTTTSIAYTYCNGVNGGTDGSCPTNGAFLATATVKGTGGVQMAPRTRTYYDALSRPLATDIQGFDGSWVRTLTIYDSTGRVWKTSRPYFLVGGSPVYTTFTYDNLGRVIQALQPDGHGYTTTAYAGLTTTGSVVRYGPAPSYTLLSTNTATTVKNDLGQVASVTDALIHTTYYTYDAVGDLLTTTDPLGNSIVNVYDLRGRKTQSTDPDMGTWTYSYDSLGRLVSQTDAKQQTTTIAYDQLGRIVSRVEPDMSSSWTYDTATYGIGKLAQAVCAAGTSGDACPGGNYTRVYVFDSLGRQTKVKITVNGSTYHADTTYNAVTDKIATVRMFGGYTTKYVYLPTTGYLSQIQDNSTGFVVWTANARDAELHLLNATAGNSVTTAQTFDPNSGAVDTISAGKQGDSNQEVANLSYDWDTAGNLADRTDTHMQGWQQETFCYDRLNRLINANFGTSCIGVGRMLVTYDAAGNILTKTNVGTYSYNPSGTGSVQPHAVSSINTGPGATVNGVQNPSYAYDANGNMTSGANRTAAWTSFNMAKSITSGSTALALTYDPEHARVQQCVPDCTSPTTTTWYLNDGASGSMGELVTSGSSTTWRTYIVADGKLVAERFVTGTNISMRYFVLDHLGSVSVITDETGAVLNDGLGHETGRFSYDSWGAMRNLDGTPDPTCAKPAQMPTTRGYTSQEEMPSVCLVNYNARIYDPQIGRFISADPSIEAPYNPQDLNRYTYVGNNPLRYTDPSGLCFLGCFWKNPIFIAILAIAIAIFVPYALAGFSFSVFTAGTLGSIAEVAVGGALAGAVSAGLTGGNILQGALFGGLSAALMAGLAPTLGNAFAGPLSVLGKVAPYAGRFIAAGAIGGLMSTVEGGNFLSGFLAAGVGSIGGALSGGQFDAGKMFISAALGGAASALGGGKFLNGAITGAFAYAAESLASQESVMTGDSGEAPPPGTVHVVPRIDMDHPFATEETALDAGQTSIDQAGQATQYQWEFGNFTVKIGDSYYNTFTETSNWAHGVVWDNTKEFMSQYDVLDYSHLHVIPALGFGFSTSDESTYGKWMSWGSPNFHGFYLETKLGSIWRLTNTSGAENHCTLGQLVSC